MTRSNPRWLMVWPAALLAVLWGGAAIGAAPPGKTDPPKPAAAPKDPPKVPKTGLSAQDIDDALEVLRAQNPDLEQQIQNVRREDPGKVEAMLREVWPRIRPLVEMKRRDPALFALTIEDLKLTRQIETLGKQIKARMDPATLEQSRVKLRELLSQRFVVRHRMRELEVAEFERRLRKMQEELAQRWNNREKEIDHEMNRLAGPPPAPKK